MKIKRLRKKPRHPHLPESERYGRATVESIRCKRCKTLLIGTSITKEHVCREDNA